MPMFHVLRPDWSVVMLVSNGLYGYGVLHCVQRCTRYGWFVFCGAVSGGVNGTFILHLLGGECSRGRVKVKVKDRV